MNRRIRFVCAALLVLLVSIASDGVLAQGRKTLDHDAYEIWNRITRPAISNDGQWVAFIMGPENKDGLLSINSAVGGPSHRFPRGDSASFSYDSRYAVFLIRAFKDSVKQAKKDKKKPEQMPMDSLGIVDLSSGQVTKVARVMSYNMPEEDGRWLAYRLEPEADEKAEAKPDSSAGSKEKNDKKGSKKKKRKPGTALILTNPADGTRHRFEDVKSYLFSEDGQYLAYSAASADSAGDGVYAVTTESGMTATVLKAKGDFKRLAFDKAGEQLAFIANHEDVNADQPAFGLYHWQAGSETARALVQAGSAGVPDGWWLSEHGEVSFSEKGKRLFFVTAPRPEPEPEEEADDDEAVKVDIWNWKDPLLQPMQLVQLNNEKKRSYQAYVEPGSGRIVQLATRDLPTVTLSRKGDGDKALANTNMRFRHLISWESPRYYDAHVIDMKNGSARRILDKVQARAELSPDGKYLAWWDRNELAWFAQATSGGEPVNLSGRIGYPVHNERHDWPYKPDPHGRAGWTAGDKRFLVYDKHDVWSLDPGGKAAPVSITGGVGRRENLRFRYVSLDRDAVAIDPDEAMLLSAFHLSSKDAGFYRAMPGGDTAPVPLVMTARAFSTPRKAKRADRLLFSRGSFVEFGDLYTADLSFNNLRRISDANPQQAEYRWGTAELVNWTSLDGIPLQGILYKPDDFDAGKKYPMMVYFYEKMSDSIHRHRPPATSSSSINFSFYVSRGYLVFVPDIPYKVGFPGQSALNAVVPGVLHVKSLGFVDGDNIGVQGHSWGGYQIAYLVTQTDLFKAAEAGAPVSNMTSAYGGIRWGSGMSRMFQYERTQSRIGGSLWEYPMRYIENSPIFWADKIKTPVLMMHNDKDGAVPWYQGIEFFVALRRLNKPVWMLNYNGEAHGLRKYQNRRDWAIRMQQFFDHFLKGEPAPVWLEQGVPALKKGKTLGLETASESIASGTQ